MKTTKYILSALCLAALAAGCTKDNAMRDTSSTPLVEGLRISVSTATPSTRTVLHENGLTVMWEKGDQLQLLSPTDSKAYLLDLDESTLSSDGTQADFVASEAIPEGEYYLASSNAVLYRNATPNKIAFSFDDDPNNESARSYITVTDANRNTHEGGLKTMALLSDEISVSADATEISAQLEHYSTLLELPILLTSNTTGTDVKLNKISLRSSQDSFIRQFMKGIGTSAFFSSSLSVIFSDTPTLPLGEPYKVYVALLQRYPEADSGRNPGNTTITVSTSVGDFTFTKPERTLDPGKRYTLSDLNINAGQTLITNEAEWNQAIAEGKDNLTLGGDVELTSSATLPTYDVTVRGDYILTMNVEGRTSSAYSDDVLYIPAANSRADIPSKLTLTEGADLTVKNGYLYINDLEIDGNGSELSGDGGRLVITNDLTVAPGASATIAPNLIVSCNSHFCEGGTLTINNDVYYYDYFPSPNHYAIYVPFAAQVGYSDFDYWYVKNGSCLIGMDDSDTYWGTRNGNRVTQGTSAFGYNLTKDTTYLSPSRFNTNIKACMIKSANIDVSGSQGSEKEFVAGSVYTGTFEDVSASNPLGARMTFGIPSKGHLPVALTGYYDYRPGTIDCINNENKTGGTDSMDLYIALATKQYSVDTENPATYPGGSSGDLASDPNIVAYGRLTSSEATSDYQSFRIELTYKDNNFTPTGDLYLLITATSSKDGIQHTGSTSSVLFLDELQLVY